MSISSKRFITWLIVGAHGLFLLSLLFTSPLNTKREQRMSVKLLQPRNTPPKTLTSNASVPSTPTKSAPSSKNKPAVKKPTPPPAVSQPKTTVPKPKNKTVAAKSTVKKAPEKQTPRSSPKKQKVVSDDLIKELEESIAKFDEKRDIRESRKSLAATNNNESIPLTPLSSFEPIQGNSFSSNEDLKELLVHELRSVLHLPDYGEVKMQLTFRSNGSISEVKILKAASKKNGEYLQNELPKHIFSFLADLNLKEKDRSFVITFYNDL